MSMTFALAASSVSLILSRTSTTRRGLLSMPASGGMTSRRTCVPFGPLIFETTSSRRQPTTSSIGPLPWPTATMRSPASSWPLLIAGPPGSTSRITVTSSCFCSCAPMPSSDSDIDWLKRSAVRGSR